MLIETPLIQEMFAAQSRKYIVRFLTPRFGAPSAELVAALETIQDNEILDDLVVWAAVCPDLDAFRARLPT